MIFAITEPGFGVVADRQIAALSPDLAVCVRLLAERLQVSAVRANPDSIAPIPPDGVLDGVFLVCFPASELPRATVGPNWLWAISARYALQVILLPR